MSHEPPRRWAIKTTTDVRDWLRSLREIDPATYRSVNVAIDMLADTGPGLGRPLDVAVRVLFVFDPWSQAVLLVAGNKAGDWSRWYDKAIPAAEIAYEGWLAFERKRREG
ncbi:type II toxin-antitoxin system RelE/ParE family toxin [Micromonospora noduli]|uniref:type II toxin-antitoxin system RelE/ParE family toxin n=1 Tax=Micromonospora noduli TaxID=709876 RepID=UPI000DC020FC|nr:type II toxin-antitoxin system RelE/ParE family toxin [Micromonospora noduli]KAB1924126.1 DNA-binding protein [Micromonospora noduli]RAO07195.1 putative toxin HigB2 [Micromonospora noduli]